MRPILTIAFLLCSYLFYGQSDIKLPIIIPPSPEVAQLSKAGSLSVGLHTGSANVSVPLYSFSVNSAQVNVMLSYGSNGIRVDDIPSRVGLGWNLVAGGVVSRTIRDEPDGDYPYYPAPADPYVKDQALLTYLQNSALSGYDTEWDEYSYSFNGQSGKFFIDGNGNGYCIPHTNFKVKVNGHNTNSKWITITTGDGIKYEFGSTVKEQTRNLDIGGGNNGGRVTKSAVYETAWFLERIITPEGGIVTFNYSPVLIKTIQGSYQTMIKPVKSNYGCNGAPCSLSEQSGKNAIEYQTNYLSSIKSSGINIEFYYENRPDGSGDTRLVNVGVRETGSATATKWFKLSYDTPIYNNNSLNKRFFLSKLSQLEIGSKSGNEADPNAGKWLSHDFEYIDIENMSERLTYSQDWWGYNNGVYNNIDFAPYIPAIASSVDNGSAGGNRNPGSLVDMQKGILKKVTYPTGGSQQFSYEPHTLLQTTSTVVYDELSANGSGIGTFDPWVHTSRYVTANADQQVSIYLRCYQNPAFPNAPSPDGLSIMYELKLKKSGSGEVVFYRRYSNYTDETVTISLTSNTTYYLELTIKGEMNAGDANIKLNHRTIYGYENKVVGGVRVREIESYDPTVSKIYKKNYTYAALSDLSKSSAEGVLFPITYAEYQTGTLCNAGKMNAYIAVCNNYMISSNSMLPSYTFGGSPYVYKTVIESDDPDFSNGLTEHFFHTAYQNPIEYKILGNSSLNLPNDMTTNYNGLEYQTRTYKRIGNQNVLIRDVQNNYEGGGADPRVNNRLGSYVTRERWKATQHSNPPASGEFDGYDLVKYDYVSGWVQLKSTVTTEYDQNGQNPLTITSMYSYDLTNLQPSQIETTTSGGGSKIIKNKYPKDFISSNSLAPNVYDAMLSKNIITPIIEQKTFKGAAFLYQTKNNYDFWLNNSLIAPVSLQASKDPSSWETRINFNSYSSSGHILEQQKTDDVKQTYIWGYAPEKPIAEVINAEQKNVFHTSFEDTEGNSAEGDSKTGRKSRVDGYTKQLSGLTNGSYLLTYWQKSGSAWSLQVNNVTVNGGEYAIVLSGQVDEVRFYPASAQMNTYTYHPLIGITSQCDINNKVTYFEYDGLGRLMLVRDQDNNILKKYCYNYHGQLEDCGFINTDPIWQATTVTRCKPCAQDTSYTINMQQHKEIDVNPNSPSYQTAYRWVDDGVAGNCSIQPNWQPTGVFPCEQEPEIDGGFSNTGNQLRQERDMNPCSPSYNSTREVFYRQNCTDCPTSGRWQESAPYCEKDGSGNNTGYQIVKETDIEPCSPTYNTTRIKKREYNPTACPLPYVCSSSNCYGNDKKCINGVCETGYWQVSSSVYKKVIVDGYSVYRWVCTWRYCFSDGTMSTYYQETYGTSSCAISCGLIL